MQRGRMMLPRRVLLTTDAVGGVYRYALDLAAGLGRQGVSCLLVGFGPSPSTEQRAACTPLANVELRWSDAPLDWMANDAAALRPVTETLAALARSWGADLLHVNAPSQAADLPGDLAVVAASHSCVPSWWRAVRGGELPPAWRWQWDRNRNGLLRADALLAPSASHANALRQLYGSLPNLRVVYNASRVAVSDRRARDIPVLSVGRWWDEAKNGSVLEAAATLSALPLVMAGPLRGPHGEAAQLAHADALGPLPAGDVLDLMRRTALFAAPSRYEPFGLAVLEAALSGAALVLADIPTFREVWGGAAVFVSPHDAHGWADAFVALTADPPRRRNLAALAQSRAREFSPQRQIDDLLSVYAAVSARHASSAAA